MNAREYLDLRGITKSYQIVMGNKWEEYAVEDLMESYHTQRSKEEAEERDKQIEITEEEIDDAMKEHVGSDHWLCGSFYAGVEWALSKLKGDG